MKDAQDNPSQAAARGEFVRALIQGAAAGLLLAAMFAAGFLFNDLLEQRTTSSISLEMLREADGLLAAHYLRPLPPDEARIHGAVSGLVESLGDPYSYFVEPQTAEVDSTNLAGRFGGIGAEIGVNEQGQFFVAQVYRDNPAFEAGLAEGDLIVAVDGVHVDDGSRDLDGVIALIRGEVGTSVTLSVLRDSQPLELTMVRAEVLLPSVFWQIAAQNAQIGYLQITRFTDRTPEEVRQALTELTDQGAQAFILDLRNNGGGLLDSSVEVAGEFLDGGVVLYEKRSGGREQGINAPRGGSALDQPLAVLINPGTASASEIVAGALQDRARAILIGQNSYGKGTVQAILPMSDGSSLHITTAEWFTPNQNRLEGQGLQPDRIVEPAGEYDAELLAAVEYLSGVLVAEGGEQP
ncbi:MAG: S41 family peptidase [Anaerolineae bacterium]